MKKLLSVLILVVFLAGCATPATSVPPAQPTQPPAQPTEPPAATQAPAEPEATALPQPGADRLTLATTTSTQDSGLLDFLLPMFEAEFGVKVDVIAVGSGQALKLGEDGNADVLLVHSPAAEADFMTNGHGTRREDVMYNDFIILGPEVDPAGINGMTVAVDAFKKIAEKQSPFISRGDKSGTDTKEKGIWKKAEIEPDGDWYISAGQGMGEVLTMAEEQQAYTLSDRATYLARTKTGLKLIIMVEGDKDLFNPYGVIAVNPEKNPNIQSDLAQKFIDWIISVAVQEKIASFGEAEFGQSLFVPDSALWRESKGIAEATPLPATEEPAAGLAFKITGKVKTEQGWTEDQIKAMATVDVESTNSKGDKETYTGILINDLLNLAEPLPEATMLVFVASDGYTVEVPLADVLACTDCIISFRSQGGFSSVMPGFAKNFQVKGVVEIQVK